MSALLALRELPLRAGGDIGHRFVRAFNCQLEVTIVLDAELLPAGYVLLV